MAVTEKRSREATSLRPGSEQKARLAKIKVATSPVQQTRWWTSRWLACLVLVLLCGAVYSGVRNHPFVDYDDEGYVSTNKHVLSGLSWETVAWSFTSTEQANWHPLTWLSHALDCEVFGLDPGAHHLSSLGFHVANVLLLFVLLEAVTGYRARSFLVAALFALHPFNADSVAWIAERKNLLSTFFF